jgi:Ulp1 family protease
LLGDPITNFKTNRALNVDYFDFFTIPWLYNKHWTMCVVDTIEKQITIFDSLGSPRAVESCIYNDMIRSRKEIFGEEEY